MSNNRLYVLGIWLSVPLLIILKWINMYRGIPNGLYISVYLVAIAFFWLTASDFSTLFSTRTEKFILLYIIYDLLSSLVTINRGYSVSIITSEIANSIIPILFFYIAEKMTQKEADVFETITMICGIFITIIGIYYNIDLDDPYYIDFLYVNQPNFSLHGFSIFPRLCAMLGSVECSTLGFVCVCFSFIFLHKKNTFTFIFFFISGAVLVFLTLQRAAMCCVLFELFVFFLYVKEKKGSLFYTILFLVILFSCLVIFQVFFGEAYQAAYTRLTMVDSAVAERSDGWMNAFSNGTFAFFFGYGLATGGQRAINISAATVNDGNYFKIIYDTGLVGLIILLLIVVYSFRKKTIMHYYSVLLICFLFQMIGSNVLTFQFTAAFFWYTLGRLNCINNQLEQDTENSVTSGQDLECSPT